MIRKFYDVIAGVDGPWGGAVKEDKGLRHNKGKVRYDLFEPFATEQLEAYKSGKDFDIDENCEDCKNKTCKNHTGLYHIAQVAWNAMAILSYYKLYPQGDNRGHHYLNIPKIGLDIDEVICDWVTTWCEKHGHDTPKAWNFSYDTGKRFLNMKPEELNEFYLNIPPKISPDEIPFEPHCYITSRSVPIELTKKWIEKNGFPTVPVYSVPFEKSKVEVAKESGIDVFLDDRYENFVELNKAGICTFLLDAPHNRRYEVGYKRVHSIKELFERFK